LTLGLFFSAGFAKAVNLFPLPILGIILLFEAVALMRLVRDTMAVPGDFGIVILVGLICLGVATWGYVVGLVVGTALVYLLPDRLSGATR
jgi:hypothetical protein